MTIKTIKCTNCSKIVFDTGSEKCPFCKQNLKSDLDMLKNLFGLNNNPFNNKDGGTYK